MTDGTIALESAKAMESARSIGSAARRSAGLILIAILFAAFSATAQTTRKTTSSSKKKPVPVAATKRSTSASRSSHSSVAANRHGRIAAREESSASTARAGTRRVVVTRRLVHGRWVRTTQIVRAAPSGPTYQTHPDQERYQQIQQALAGAGYFKGEPNGQWGDDSVAALKQFQMDHKLVNDGKISSLSLIGLGLGPTREVATKPLADSTPVPAIPAAPPEPTRN